MTLTEQVAALLDSLGVGVYDPGGTTGTIYLVQLPEAPDVAMAVARYAGPDGDQDVDDVSVQVRVRGTTADTRIGEQLAQQVYEALHGLTDVTLAGGAHASLIYARQSGPTLSGRDTNGRDEWTINVQATIDRA
jgi:hypothetical protein